MRLLLEFGADPLGDRAHNPHARCPFLAAADEGNPGKVMQTFDLKARNCQGLKAFFRKNAMYPLHSTLFKVV